MIPHYDARQTIPAQVSLERPEHWTEQAACIQQPLSGDWDPWFPDADQSVRSYAEARSVCNECPVKQPCLDAAMAEERGRGRSFRDGMRGGLSPTQRVELESGTPKPGPSDEPGTACTDRTGSETGYQRHRAAKEKACRPCTDAQSAATARRKAAGKARRELDAGPVLAPTPAPDWLVEAHRNALAIVTSRTTHIRHPRRTA